MKESKGKGKGNHCGKGRGRSETRSEKSFVRGSKSDKVEEEKEKSAKKPRTRSSGGIPAPVSEKAKANPKAKSKRVAGKPPMLENSAVHSPEAKSQAAPKRKKPSPNDENVPAKKQKGQHPEVVEAVDGGAAKTFARRRRPSTVAGSMKWDTLRSVFNDRIRPNVPSPSTKEDPRF